MKKQVDDLLNNLTNILKENNTRWQGYVDTVFKNGINCKCKLSKCYQ